MPASQNACNLTAIRSRISSRTLVSQPTFADAGRGWHTSQIDDASDDRFRFLSPPGISVAIGHVLSTQKPARITDEAKVSQASGFLFANTTTSRPFCDSAARHASNAFAMPSSYTCCELRPL